KAIPSAEAFGKAAVGQAPAPQHTHDLHRQCAYYEGKSASGNFLIECSHSVPLLGGALYSEDHVNDLRRVGQQFLGEVQSLLRGHPNPSILLPSLEEFTKTF